MLADQLASIPAETTNNTLPILTLLERLRKLAPDGMLPPVDFGDDVLEWTDIKPGPRIAEALDVRERQPLTGEFAGRASRNLCQKRLRNSIKPWRSPKPTRKTASINTSLQSWRV